MFSKVILYIAISADGFIADKQGSVAWLDVYNTPELSAELNQHGFGFESFYATIDALAIGKNTYEQVLTFGPWHFVGKKSYIFVDKNTPLVTTNDIEFVYSDIPEFMHELARKKVEHLWLMGGAKLAESFYNHGFIDEYIITIVPTVLHEGIPLLPAIASGKGTQLIKEIVLPSGIIQKQYGKIS